MTGLLLSTGGARGDTFKDSCFNRLLTVEDKETYSFILPTSPRLTGLCSGSRWFSPAVSLESLERSGGPRLGMGQNQDCDQPRSLGSHHGQWGWADGQALLA